MKQTHLRVIRGGKHPRGKDVVALEPARPDLTRAYCVCALILGAMLGVVIGGNA